MSRIIETCVLFLTVGVAFIAVPSSEGPWVRPIVAGGLGTIGAMLTAIAKSMWERSRAASAALPPQPRPVHPEVIDALAECPRCGFNNPSGSRFCASCGAAVPGTQTVAPGAIQRVVRPRIRPLWLVGALTASTFGIYSLYWMYTTWRELKAELRDESMSPAWHALTQLVLVYNLFRFHAHMRTIREVAESHGVATALSPGACVLITLAGYGVARFTGDEVTPLDLVAYGAIASAIMWGQQTLNNTWAAILPPGSRNAHSHWLEGVILALGLFVWFCTLYVWSCENQGWSCGL